LCSDRRRDTITNLNPQRVASYIIILGNAIWTNFCSGNPYFVKLSTPATVDHGFQPDPLRALVFPPLIARTRREDCIPLINIWIAECCHTHPPCQRQPLSPLPSRVIDVGSENPNKDPWLYETHGEHERYIALSHCWGTSQHFTTTIATLKARCEGMSWDSLPKTFQDAIFLTRALKIQFLWIDSLCIIQDNR